MAIEHLELIHAGLLAGKLIPYTGPGILELSESAARLPGTPEALVGKLTAKASVPHKVRKNLTAAAQFIENFKHRKTVKAAMTEAFSPEADPSGLHRFLAGIPHLPLWVHAWYDGLPQQALAQESRAWGAAQGVSRSEHAGDWVHFFDADGSRRREADADGRASPWPTLLYQPLGSVAPAANYLVSDSDFVEVLTEIDIQSPIPEAVRRLRATRGFLFLGCRFATQLERTFARQIMKRSSGNHWAVLPEEPTRNERRFLEEQGIRRLAVPLRAWADALTALPGFVVPHMVGEGGKPGI